MPFLIETWDKPGSQQLRRDTRDEHLDFLAHHKALLLACGAKLNDDGTDQGGGLYVVDLATREEAEQFIAADPFYRVALFERVAITRWRKAYVAGECLL
ncbi:YciI family protein [Pseudomonas kairouanensis]|uniref:YciI family protein n=1 Tax=Pseudomonas kairouanensis TaxID=2293832 RepID=A0A4Z0AHA7_9PSED|nr:YciI family protein [Pseudomonas kairouanensis]TFY85985.1 YciI family protein [Pseudomonas kairouanensis]